MPELNPYESPTASAAESNGQVRFQVPKFACLVVFAANAGVVFAILALFRFPYGSSGRPFIESMVACAFILFGLLIGIPVVIKSYFKSPDIRVRLLCIALFILCLSPALLLGLMMGVVENLNGFEFLD